MHKMIKVLGGKFMMGADSSDSEAFDNERPQREVEVKDFELESHPVTNLLWWEVMGGERPFKEKEHLPKLNVSWFDCVKFMNARSEKEGLKPVYIIKDLEVSEDLSADGYRLPSEEEWEYAARAGTTGPRYGEVDEIAVYGRQQICEVGTKKPNAWGFFDMLGLVWEWTGSKYISR